MCEKRNVTSDHCYSSKHEKAEQRNNNLIVNIRKDNDALFFKFYPQTFIQLKYIPWRVKMQKQLEDLYETGEWNNRTTVPDVKSEFEKLKFRDAFAFLELKIIKYFMGGKAILPKKRKLCDIDSQDLDESTGDSIDFETARVKYTFILRLILPFLKKGKK